VAPKPPINNAWMLLDYFLPSKMDASGLTTELLVLPLPPKKKMQL